MKKLQINFLVTSIMTILVMSATAALIPVYAIPSSSVAIIGGPGIISGGTLPTTDAAFSSFTFTTIGVSPLPSLVPYDTVVLNVASTAVSCDLSGSGGLSAAELAAIVTFMTGGGKLIIYDSECPTVSYTWLPATLQFMTSNPGQLGAGGTAVIIEQNVLSTTPVTGAADVDVVSLCSTTDACGDSNVMTALGTDLCKDIDADNAVLTTFEPVHVYSRSGGGSGSGMMVYNGFDQDFNFASAVPSLIGGGNLAKLFLNELNAGFAPHDSSLICGTPIIETPAVGGEIIPIDSVALMVAGIQSSSIWMASILSGAAGAVVFYLKTRKN